MKNSFKFNYIDKKIKELGLKVKNKKETDYDSFIFEIKKKEFKIFFEIYNKAFENDFDSLFFIFKDTECVSKGEGNYLKTFEEFKKELKNII